MSKRAPIPVHPDGWKFSGRAGRFHIWRPASNDYRITDGAAGSVVHQTTQLSLAFSKACHLDKIQPKDPA